MLCITDLRFRLTHMIMTYRVYLHHDRNSRVNSEKNLLKIGHSVKKQPSTGNQDMPVINHNVIWDTIK